MFKELCTSFFRKKWDFYTYVKAFLAVMLISQALFIIYINLFQMKYHLGFDASSYYLSSMEMWRQKSLILKDFFYTTNIFTAPNALIAALLYGISGNILVSYGISNLIMGSCMVAAFSALIKSAKLSSLSALILLNMFLCPYLPTDFSNINDLSYVSMLFTSGGYYAGKITCMLLIIKNLMDMEGGHKNFVLMFLTLPLVFLEGVSSLYFAITVLVPAVLYIIIKAAVKNNWRRFISFDTAYIAVLLALTAAGKVVASKCIPAFSSTENALSIVNASNFFVNIGNIINGFFMLTGATTCNDTVTIMSFSGISHIAGYIVALILLVSAAYYVLSIKNREASAFIPFLIVICSSILVFSLADLTYGSKVYEYRYLIHVFVCGMFLVGFFIDSISEGVFKKLGILLLCFSILSINVYSDRAYMQNKYDSDSDMPIVDRVSDFDVNAVYVYGTPNLIFARNMRVMDDKHVYIFVGEDYTAWQGGSSYQYYRDCTDQNAKHLLITSEDGISGLPAHIRECYKEVYRANGKVMYYAEKNRFDFLFSVNADVNIQYPYSPATGLANGELDTERGVFTTNGTGGVCVSGDTAFTDKGIYDVALNYTFKECSSDRAGVLNVFINGEDTPFASVPIDKNTESAVITGVPIDGKDFPFAYSLYSEQGSVIEFQSLVITEQR